MEEATGSITCPSSKAYKGQQEDGGAGKEEEREGLEVVFNEGITIESAVFLHTLLVPKME